MYIIYRYNGAVGETQLMWLAKELQTAVAEKQVEIHACAHAGAMVMSVAMLKDMRRGNLCQQKMKKETHTVTHTHLHIYAQYIYIHMHRQRETNTGAYMQTQASRNHSNAHARQRVILFSHVPIHPRAASQDCLLFNFHQVRIGDCVGTRCMLALRAL